MKQLATGQFFGQTNATIDLGGLILTDTEYTQDKVDWHYHENAYFTFILQGNVIERNKKEDYYCSAGTLLFHNWQEPHYNIKPKGFTRGFHIEIEQNWLQNYLLDLNMLQGSVSISNPDLKIWMYKIFRETKINDAITTLSIQEQLLKTFSHMQHTRENETTGTPAWVKKVKELLHDQYAEKNSLAALSAIAGIHPVHLSRGFSKYFHCTMGDYIRKLRIEKSLSMLPDRENALTDISFECGFADQSHFNRCFREIVGVNPMAYRKILRGQ